MEPRHLFRPTPDPEISDREAVLEFPLNGFELNGFETISTQYQEWFSAQFTNRYSATGKAYP